MLARILGAVAALWGGAILVSALLRGGAEGSGSYAGGQIAGFIFGGLLFCVGLYYLIKGGNK